MSRATKVTKAKAAEKAKISILAAINEAAEVMIARSVEKT